MAVAESTAALPPRRWLRVLCFGDSLTAGYSSWGAVFHPYRYKLEQMLTMAFPDLEIDTVDDGYPGDAVCRGFRDRILRHFPEPKKISKSPRKDIQQNGDDNPSHVNGNANSTNGVKREKADDSAQSSDGSADDTDDSRPYDWAIILGGTNDLALGYTPTEIFNALKRVWDVALSRRCKVLALTVPDAGLHGALRAEMDAERNRLNDLIRSYKRDGFHVYDLNRHVPYWSMPEADRRRFWDDHIHFTAAGYDLIGNKVGIALVSLLARQRGLEPQRPQQKRRKIAFKGDERRYDEEEDVPDPAVIDKGYVVVRYVDLE